MAKAFPTDFTSVTPPLTGDELALFDLSKKASLNQIKGFVVETVIWRPTEPSPAGNVFATWAALAAVIATKKGRVEVICDHTLSSTFTIAAGAYPLACIAIEFVGWRNSPATVAVSAGVTFTGGTIRSIAIDGVRLEWQGTSAPLIPAITSTLFVDLYRGGVLGADNGNSAVMFTIDELAILRLHDPSCAIEASNYELFLITDTSLIQVYLSGFFTTLGNDFARSSGTGADDGSVQVLYDSGHGQTLPTSMGNLNVPLSAIDSAIFGASGRASADTTADLSPGQTWTTVRRYHATDNGRSEACAVLIDSAIVTAAMWPVGEVRELAKYNTSLFGLAILMGANDTLNGGSVGVGSGVIAGTTNVPSATVARPTVKLRRDGTTAWSWWI